MSEKVDLDELERESKDDQDIEGYLIVPLIAELRVARAVVEAAREVPVAAVWLMTGITGEPVHRDVIGTFEALTHAVADYDRLTGERQ